MLQVTCRDRNRAMALALVVVGWLIHFIHHISQSISVNHIVDRIARETELVIDEFMPSPRGPFQLQDRSEPSPAADGTPILNRKSGYIRYTAESRQVTASQRNDAKANSRRRRV